MDVAALSESGQDLRHERRQEPVLVGHLLYRVLEEEGPVRRLQYVGVHDVDLVLAGGALRVPVLDGDAEPLDVPGQGPDHVLVGRSAVDAVCAQSRVERAERLAPVALLLQAVLRLPVERELQLGRHLREHTLPLGPLHELSEHLPG